MANDPLRMAANYGAAFMSVAWLTFAISPATKK
jgi:hypothetical protein